MRQPVGTYVDLFAGAGGLSLGLERAGFELAHAVEINDDARSTFAANRGNLDTHALSTDIRAIRKSEIRRRVGASHVDLVAGGPPCQGFSEVGKRDGSDPRNHLFNNFIEWVEALRPDAALFENVRGMSVTAGGSFLRAVKRAFSGIGYQVVHQTLSAADFGVPQLRRRIVVLATKSQVPGISLEASAVQPGRLPSVMDGIGDLPMVRAGESTEEYTTLPMTVLQADLRGGCERLTDHKAVPHPDWLVEAISHIPDGGNRRSIPDRLQPKSGFHNSYARLRSDEPAVAITSNLAKPSSARCVHPFQHRGLTAREGARLQTFPDSYTFYGGDVAKRLQIGNAVPPYLAEAVGLYLAKEVFSKRLGENERQRAAILANGANPVGRLAFQRKKVQATLPTPKMV